MKGGINITLCTLCVGEVGLEDGGGGINITLCVGEVGLEESQTDIHRLSTASRLALFSRKQNYFFKTQKEVFATCSKFLIPISLQSIIVS